METRRSHSAAFHLLAVVRSRSGSLQPHRRRLLSALLAAALSVIAVVSAVLVAPDSAAAADLGPGYQRPGYALDHLGGYRTPDGTIAYCIDIGEPSTLGGTTVDSGVAGQVNDLDPAAMLRLNILLSRHGATGDASTAAAVAMAVWSIADRSDYQAAGGDGALLLRAPASARSGIQALADDFRAEAASFAPPTVGLTAEIGIDDGDDYSGSLSLTIAPPTATASATLENAVFADTGIATRERITSGEALRVRGVPRGAQAYRVSVSASTSTDGGPSSSVRLFRTPGAQTLVAAGPPTVLTATATATDLRDRRVPSLTTVAQPTGIVGGTVSDTAVVTDVPSSGADLVWHGYLQPTGARAPVCTESERIFTSSPQRVAADGSYRSEAFTVLPAYVGTVYWVATLTVDGSAPIVDSCGAAGELSTLVPAPDLPVVSG